ncbi:hypothetical protein CEXT_334111 [Caerostris extrusa]|uniref:Uncharacterized protein n=1 Tax=Caerostris extrusa TaxID=172846 RepID=A0AAV4XZR2_CAEEX|nr:hypothetical protein CEXT_334111 [Caerostris extrusa]
MPSLCSCCSSARNHEGRENQPGHQLHSGPKHQTTRLCMRVIRRCCYPLRWPTRPVIVENLCGQNRVSWYTIVKIFLDSV